MQTREWQERLGLHSGRGQAAHLPLRRLLPGGDQQRGLADSGRPSYDKSASDTLLEIVDDVAEPGELLVASV